MDVDIMLMAIAISVGFGLNEVAKELKLIRKALEAKNAKGDGKKPEG